MTTAFMQYIWGFEQLEGWVGIDQWCPENPRMHRFHRRFIARYGEDPWMWPNAIPGLAYDMAAAIGRGAAPGAVLTRLGRQATASSASASCPRSPAARTPTSPAGPFDHQMFKGDWLHYGRVRDGKLEFAGLLEATDDY